MQRDVNVSTDCSADRAASNSVLNLLALLMSAMLGGAIAFSIFPRELLVGGDDYWNQIIGDNAAGIIGFYSFAQDKWRWPLLYTELINYPIGANIYYTDAVPVMALIFKAIFKLTGYLYPYFGIWILFSYMMNSMFGYIILRHLKIDIASSLIASLMFVLLPEFIWRYVHIGLIGQFSIVLSFYIYVRFTSVASLKEILIVSIFSSVAVAINVYIFVMCAAIVVAGLLDAWRLKRITFGGVAVAMAGMAAAVIAIAAALGLIGTGDALPASGGFGQYSMNLLSPIWPQYSILTDTGFLDPIGGQYEGFNYLGLGILCLFALSIVLCWGKYAQALKSRPFIFIILIALLFYALSRIVYMGSVRVAVFSYHEWPIIGRITEILRSSGRFFWPVGYAIVISSVVFLHRKLSRFWFIGIAVLAVTLQIVDLQPLFRVAHVNSKKYLADGASDKGVTVDLMRSRDVVLVFPGALCGVSEDLNPALQIQLLAARAGRPFDGAYINRGNRPCSEIAAAFAKDPFRGSKAPHAMLVLMKGSSSPTEAAYGLGPDVLCREGKSAYFCGRAPLDEQLQGVGAAVNAPVLPLGVALRPSADGSEFLMGGWTAAGAPNSPFRWAEGQRVRFVGRLPHEVCGSLTFSAEILPFAFKDYAVKSAIVDIAGGSSKTITLDQIRQQRIDLVFPLDRCVEQLDLTFKFSDLKSPLEVGMNKDPRRVTWGFFNFRVEGSANP